MSWNFPEDLTEAAWGIIANVDWDKQSPEWVEAAGKWRDAYYEMLGLPAPSAPIKEGE
jgi:hypothetical protein